MSADDERRLSRMQAGIEAMSERNRTALLRANPDHPHPRDGPSRSRQALRFQELAARTSYLTRQWSIFEVLAKRVKHCKRYGRPCLSLIYEHLIELSHFDGNSPYRFERDIRQQRSRDGYVRVIDGTASSAHAKSMSERVAPLVERAYHFAQAAGMD